MECKLPECIKKYEDWSKQKLFMPKKYKGKDCEMFHCSVEGCHKLFLGGIGCKCSDCDKWFCMKHEMKFLLTIIHGRVDDPLCFQCAIAEDDARHGRNTDCDECGSLEKIVQDVMMITNVTGAARKTKTKKKTKKKRKINVKRNKNLVYFFDVVGCPNVAASH
jgi:hypothetical protein